MAQGKVTQGWHTGYVLGETKISFRTGAFDEQIPVVHVGRRSDFITLTANNVERVVPRRKDNGANGALGGFILGGAVGAAVGYALSGDSIYALEIYYKNGKADLVEGTNYDTYKIIVNCLNRNLTIYATQYDALFPSQRDIEGQEIETLRSEASKAQAAGDHRKAVYYLERLLDKKYFKKMKVYTIYMDIMAILGAISFLSFAIMIGFDLPFVLVGIASVGGCFYFGNYIKPIKEYKELKEQLEKERALLNSTPEQAR